MGKSSSKRFTVHAISDDLSAFRLAEAFGPDACLHRLIHLAKRHGCKCVVEERGASAAGWDDEHKGFYSKLFRPIARDITRLLFFSQDLKLKDLTPSSASLLQASFLGFCSLRPLLKQRVVEAYLPPPTENVTAGKKTFPLCLVKKRVELGGGTGLVLEAPPAFPFMQQDGNFDCCAHVALKTVNEYLASKWGALALTVEEVVDAARLVRLAKRDAPTQGLSVDEIATVIKHMGLDVLAYYFPDKPEDWKFPPERVIYHYVESGLPVLLGIPTANSGHALVAVGHTFDPDEWWPDAAPGYYSQRHSGGCYHCSTTWLCEFLVSDDNFGPYLTIPKDCLRTLASSKYLMVIVPIRREINFKGEDAEVYAHVMLRAPYYAEQAKQFPPGSSSGRWAQVFWTAYQEQRVVLRTFLTESEKVRRGYLESDYPEDFKILMRGVKLPERVWVTEFSVPHLFPEHRKLLGQILVDPTVTPLMEMPAYLVVRLPGHLLVRDQNDLHSSFLWETDYPREHEIRR